MPTTTLSIHGHKVNIDEHSHSAKQAAKYLEENESNAKAFFDEARHHNREEKEGIAHFKIVKPLHYDGSTHFTLIHNRESNEYELRKKHHDGLF
ncbi:MAG: hypothetical protein AAB510_02450 [Patescibacteria group bacterium]